MRLSRLDGLAAVALLGCYTSAAGPDGGDGSCRSDEACQDGNPCNGTERCGADGVCQPGSPLPETAACDDGDACTTGDCCAAGQCVGGTALACDDGDPCTGDRCEPATGCVHEMLAVVHRDRDGDGFGSASEDACFPIGEIPVGYSRVNGDCLDSDPAVHPNATEFHPTPYVAGAGGTPTFDYDCNGVEEPQSAVVADACEIVGGVCPNVLGWCDDPALHAGCIGVPACGEAGRWQEGCRFLPPPDGDATGGDEDAGGGKSLDAGLGEPTDDPGDAAVKESPPWEDFTDTSGWTCTPIDPAPLVQACR